MEKTYYYEVKIISDCYITAKNEKEARNILKENWKDTNDIELENNEISLIEVLTEKQNKDGTKDIKID